MQPTAQTARFAGLVEDFLYLTAHGETHPDAIRIRLGCISVTTLERIRRAAKKGPVPVYEMPLELPFDDELEAERQAA